MPKVILRASVMLRISLCISPICAGYTYPSLKKKKKKTRATTQPAEANCTAIAIAKSHYDAKTVVPLGTARSKHQQKAKKRKSEKRKKRT